MSVVSRDNPVHKRDFDIENRFDKAIRTRKRSKCARPHRRPIHNAHETSNRRPHNAHAHATPTCCPLWPISAKAASKDTRPLKKTGGCLEHHARLLPEFDRKVQKTRKTKKEKQSNVERIHEFEGIMRIRNPKKSRMKCSENADSCRPPVSADCVQKTPDYADNRGKL
jgi:hypothetical protein